MSLPSVALVGVSLLLLVEGALAFAPLASKKKSPFAIASTFGNHGNGHGRPLFYRANPSRSPEQQGKPSPSSSDAASNLSRNNPIASDFTKYRKILEARRSGGLLPRQTRIAPPSTATTNESLRANAQGRSTGQETAAVVDETTRNDPVATVVKSSSPSSTSTIKPKWRSHHASIESTSRPQAARGRHDGVATTRARKIEQRKGAATPLGWSRAISSRKSMSPDQMILFLAEQYVLMVKGRLGYARLVMMNSSFNDALPSGAWDKHVEDTLGITPQLKQRIVSMPGTATEIVSFLIVPNDDEALTTPDVSGGTQVNHVSPKKTMVDPSTQSVETNIKVATSNNIPNKDSSIESSKSMQDVSKFLASTTADTQPPGSGTPKKDVLSSPTRSNSDALSDTLAPEEMSKTRSIDGSMAANDYSTFEDKLPTAFVKGEGQSLKSAPVSNVPSKQGTVAKAKNVSLDENEAAPSIGQSVLAELEATTSSKLGETMVETATSAPNSKAGITTSKAPRVSEVRKKESRSKESYGADAPSPLKEKAILSRTTNATISNETGFTGDSSESLLDNNFSKGEKMTKTAPEADASFKTRVAGDELAKEIATNAVKGVSPQSMEAASSDPTLGADTKPMTGTNKTAHGAKQTVEPTTMAESQTVRDIRKKSNSRNARKKQDEESKAGTMAEKAVPVSPASKSSPKENGLVATDAHPSDSSSKKEETSDAAVQAEELSKARLVSDVLPKQTVKAAKTVVSNEERRMGQPESSVQSDIKTKGVHAKGAQSQSAKTGPATVSDSKANVTVAKTQLVSASSKKKATSRRRKKKKHAPKTFKVDTRSQTRPVKLEPAPVSEASNVTSTVDAVADDSSKKEKGPMDNSRKVETPEREEKHATVSDLQTSFGEAKARVVADISKQENTSVAVPKEILNETRTVYNEVWKATSKTTFKTERRASHPKPRPLKPNMGISPLEPVSTVYIPSQAQGTSGSSQMLQNVTSVLRTATNMKKVQTHPATNQAGETGTIPASISTSDSASEALLNDDVAPTQNVSTATMNMTSETGALPNRTELRPPSELDVSTLDTRTAAAKKDLAPSKAHRLVDEIQSKGAVGTPTLNEVLSEAHPDSDTPLRGDVPPSKTRRAVGKVQSNESITASNDITPQARTGSDAALKENVSTSQVRQRKDSSTSDSKANASVQARRLSDANSSPKEKLRSWSPTSEKSSPKSSLEGGTQTSSQGDQKMASTKSSARHSQKKSSSSSLMDQAPLLSTMKERTDAATPSNSQVKAQSKSSKQQSSPASSSAKWSDALNQSPPPSQAASSQSLTVTNSTAPFLTAASDSKFKRSDAASVTNQTLRETLDEESLAKPRQPAVASTPIPSQANGQSANVSEQEVAMTESSSSVSGTPSPVSSPATKSSTMHPPPSTVEHDGQKQSKAKKDGMRTTTTTFFLKDPVENAFFAKLETPTKTVTNSIEPPSPSNVQSTHAIASSTNVESMKPSTEGRRRSDSAIDDDALEKLLAEVNDIVAEVNVIVGGVEQDPSLTLLVPEVEPTREEDESSVMARAEMWNGRLAMFVLIVCLAIEEFTGATLPLQVGRLYQVYSQGVDDLLLPRQELTRSPASVQAQAAMEESVSRAGPPHPGPAASNDWKWR